MKERFPRRKQLRLKEYDYSQEGYYFITICTQNRLQILSKIIDDYIPNIKPVGADSISAQNIKLTSVGKLIERVYLNLEKEFPNIKLHDYVIMPNHMHGIIEICDRAEMDSAPTINRIIQSFKRHSTIEYIKGVKKGIYKPFDKRIWQRNYYEHVIRNEKEYYLIKQYIQNNPLNWEKDKYY